MGSLIISNKSAVAVEQIFRTHFARGGLTVLDLTYGQGGFWKWDWRARSITLTTNDLHAPQTEEGCTHLTLDFTQTGLPDRSYDVVIFDPPHSRIGRPSAKLGGSDWAARYGAGRTAPGAPHHYRDVADWLVAGTREACRLARQGVVVKTKAVVESAISHPSPLYARMAMLVSGWSPADTLYFKGGGFGARPEKAQHFRNVVSEFVVGKPGAEWRRDGAGAELVNRLLTQCQPSDCPAIPEGRAMPLGAGDDVGATADPSPKH